MSAYDYDERKHRPPRGVLQCDERGEMPFDNALTAAEAAGVGYDTMCRWIRDGGKHRGFVWKLEPKGEERCDSRE
jgi:hypothetical protein